MLVQHSHVLQDQFAQRVKAFSGLNANRLRNLSMAKQRFSSTQLPLGRCVIHIESLISVCEWIHATRATNERLHAARFLGGLTVSKLLLVALLADAGDETSSVCRLFDNDDYDSSGVATSLDLYRQRIHYLFLERGALRVNGYTSYMMETLSKRRIYQCPCSDTSTKTYAKSLGGPGTISAEVLDTCFEHMSAWVRLALETMRAEYPGSELLQTFSIFSLANVSEPEQFSEKCARMGQIFSMDQDALQTQLLSLRLHAIKAHQTGTDTAFKAWKKAIEWNTRQAHVKARRDTTTLLEAVKLFGVWNGATTSGVEQTFSSMVQMSKPQRASHLSELMMRCELKVCRDITEDDLSDIVSAAQRIWTEHFGAPRRRFERHAAAPNLGTCKPDSERTWLKHRRDSVYQALKEQSQTHKSFEDTQARACALSTSVWTDELDKFSGKLDRKARISHAIALEDGNLLPSEVTDTVQRDLQAVLSNRKTAHRALELKDMRKQQISADLTRGRNT